MKRFIWASLCIPCLLGAGADANGAREKPVPTKLKEEVLVQRVIWPVLVDVHPRRGKPGDCENLNPAQIVVEEDGAPVLVESLDREPRPTIHVILLDVSGSMVQSGRLDEAREAAKRYIAWLRPDEQVMVLTFSGDLVLHVPLTSLAREGARAEIEKAIDRIKVLQATALRDALFQVIRFLAGYPERKVVVLLSDGWDTVSLQSEDTVRGLAATAADLTIFPIAVEPSRDLVSALPRSSWGPGAVVSNDPNRAPTPGMLGLVPGRASSAPVRAAGPPSDPRPFLKDLAANSGGEYFELNGLGRLGETFQRVRDRLNREVYVTYVPLPFREGPRDPKKKPYTFRKVNVRSDDPRCVLTGPRRERFVAPEPPRSARQAGPSESRRDEKGVLPVPSRVTIPPPAGWADRSLGGSFLLLEPGGVFGQTTDIVEEWGLVFEYLKEERTQEPSVQAAYRPLGPIFEYPMDDAPAEVKARTGTEMGAPDDGSKSLTAHIPSGGAARDAGGEGRRQRALRFQASFRSPQEARFGARRIYLPLPPLEQTLRRSLAHPEDVLLHWFLHDIEVELSKDHEREDRIRPVVNGQTIHELAPFFAMSIFDHYPDYRAWAQARLRRDIEEDIRRVFPSQPDDLIQKLVASRLDAQTPESLQPYLGAWLADLHAADLVRSLELRTSNELLRISPAGLPAVEDVADRVERGWPALRFWFRPPDHARIVAPLFLFHDVERDVIGFIRVLLPQSSWLGGNILEAPSRTVPEYPRTLRLVRWMLGVPEVFEELRGQWQIEDFFYRDVPRSEILGEDARPRKGKREDRPETLVEVAIVWRPTAPDGPPAPYATKVYVEEDGGSWRPVCGSADPQGPLGTVLGRAGLPPCAGEAGPILRRGAKRRSG